MPELHSIAREAADCRAAWAAHPRAKYGAHLHHGSEPFETLTEPIEARIVYILDWKPKHEQALRLRLMRPVASTARAERDKATVAPLAEYNKIVVMARVEYAKARVAARAEFEKTTVAAWAEYNKAMVAVHQRLCPTPDCPWDGQSIFGEADHA